MNKHLKDLVELSLIDNEIDSFSSRVVNAKIKLTEILKNKQSIEDEIQSLNNAITDDKLKKSRNNLYLSELSEKLENIAQKSKAIKTEREMKALGLEEEITKEQINFANEEIERLEKSIEIKEKSIVEVSEKLKEIQDAETIENQNVQGTLDNIEKEKTQTYKSKETTVAKMDSKIITFYEKIKRWAGNSTVVPVKKQACYGCYMKLNDRTYSEVIKSEEIISCPHCGRILYYEEQEVV